MRRSVSRSSSFASPRPPESRRAVSFGNGRLPRRPGTPRATAERAHGPAARPGPDLRVVFVQSDGSSWTAGWIFLVAGVTDQLDGFLARRWHVESRFGKLADPLADRLMLDAAAILLWLDDKLPWYGALIIVLRDVILVGGYRLLMPKGVELSVSMLGKAATWMLYLSLGILLVVGHDTEWPLWLFWIGLGMALVAAAQYVVKARREVAT